MVKISMSIDFFTKYSLDMYETTTWCLEPKMYILHFTFKHVFKKVGDFDFWHSLVQFYKSEVKSYFLFKYIIESSQK